MSPKKLFVNASLEPIAHWMSVSLVWLANIFMVSAVIIFPPTRYGDFQLLKLLITSMLLFFSLATLIASVPRWRSLFRYGWEGEKGGLLNLFFPQGNEVAFNWNIADQLWLFDKNFESLLGYPPSETPTNKETYFRLIHLEDVPRVEKRLQEKIIKENAFFEVTYRLRHKNGHWCWILARTKVTALNERGEPLKVVGTLVDITTSKGTPERLRLLNRILDTIGEGIIVTDPEFKIVQINRAFSYITGFVQSEVIGQPVEFLYNDKKNQGFYAHMRYALYLRGCWQGELWERRKDEKVYLQRLNINAVRDANKNLIHYIIVFSDITQYKQTEDQLYYLTHYDGLTHLPNRTLFMKELETTILRIENTQEKIVLMLISLDNFKLVNDSSGHDVGDYLLQLVAKRLLRCLDKESVVARIATDEFAVIFQKKTGNAKILRETMQQLVNVLSTNFVIDQREMLLKPAIGVSIFPDDSKQANDLLMYASIALYHAKFTQKNTFAFYTSEMNNVVQTKQRMELLLRHAMANKEFSVFYQPKINVKNGKVCGAEALLRWKNSELGCIPSGEFIPIAEECGIIVPLGYWVLRTACEQVKKWQMLGFKNLKVSVNLSAQQFRMGDLVREVARVLLENDLTPHILDLELTESVLMDNMERSALRLKVLKTMGVTISIDDFGTGYSSLSYLRRFPIDALKIDRSFINNICLNPEDAAIVKAIIAMAKELNLRTIAEGIETIEQATYLQSQEIDELQGFYFGQPMNAEEFTQHLQQSTAKIISL